MNIAVIFAGGVGQRMHSGTTPKQFLELHGKPILIYTIEQFQKNKNIDGIVLVSIESWIDYSQELIERFHLSKVTAVVPGGDTGFESISNGLKKANELYPLDSTVLIHDGVRPLINQDTINNAIASVAKYGSAITVSPVIETIITCNKNNQVNSFIDRSQCKIAKAPQCFILKDILEAHMKADKEGLSDFIDSASLMYHYGYELHLIEGPSDNIKITTPSDFYIFKAFIEARTNLEVFG